MDELFVLLLALWFAVSYAVVGLFVAVIAMLYLAPYIIGASLVGGIGFVTYRALKTWNWRRINSPEHLAKELDALHLAIKQQMIELAQTPC